MRDREWNEPDIDWDSPPCVEGCQCPLCQHGDREEDALLARLDAADRAGALDLESLAVLASKPWRAGLEPERAA